MQPQDWSRADKVRAADLLTKYAAALEELQAVKLRRAEHWKTARATGAALNKAVLGECNAAEQAVRERLAVLGDALALLGIPPFRGRAMSLDEYTRLPQAYKDAIENFEQAHDAARRKGAA